MKTPVKVLLVTLAVGIPVFLLEPNGPLGGFWEPHPDVEDATGIQVPLFIVLGLAEALMFGLGVAFVVLGYSLLKAIGKTSKVWTLATFISIAWILLNPNPPMRSGLGVGTRGEGRGTRRSALDSDKWGRWRPLVVVGGADGGPGQRRWCGVGGTACRGRQSRTGPVRLCGAVE